MIYNKTLTFILIFIIKSILASKTISQTSAQNITLGSGNKVLLSANDDLKNGLVAYFPFNGNAKDESGNGKNAYTYGPVLTTDRFGYNNSAYNFSGTSDFMKTTITSLAGSELTIAYWYKGTYLNSAVSQVDGGRFINSGIHINNSPVIHRIWNDQSTNLSAGGPTVENDQWHHVAMTWKQNSVNGFKSYLDGVLITQRNSVDVPIPLILGNVILGSYNGSINFTKGILDDVAIYKRSLSEQEIKILAGHYNWSGGGLSNIENNLAGAFVLCAPLQSTNIIVEGIDGAGGNLSKTTSVTVHPASSYSLSPLEININNQKLITPISSLTSGLVGYYPFNGDASDESDNGKNGYVYGPTLTTDRFGNENSAYLFNGNSDYY